MTWFKFNKTIQYLSLLFVALLAISCSNDDYPGQEDFVVAFEKTSDNYSGEEISKTINLVFSTPAPEDGTVDLIFNSETLLYGEDKDFSSEPSVSGGVISVPFSKGSSSTSFSIFKHTDVLPGEEKSIKFDIAEVITPDFPAYTQGNTSLQVNFSESASLGGSISPEVGGPNEPNQVYVHLASQTETAVRRDVWDLGFYSGDGFYVKLNSSLYMFAGSLETTQMNAINSSSSLVSELKNKMNFLVEGSDKFVDHPKGDLDKLAIQEISENDEENPVYLVKMGNEIGTDTPETGSVAVAGADRGWKKIRILRQGEDYLLQYANLDDTQFQETVISKTPGYSFTFYSMVNAQIAQVEPEAGSWDLNFTVNIEIENLPGTGSQTAYGFSDYVQTNSLGNVEAYRVSTNDFSYEDFTSSDIDENQLVKDQRIIGSSWRNTIPPDRGVLSTIFYVLKDSAGNYYKLKFTAMENENGLRGYPKFKYELLQ